MSAVFIMHLQGSRENDWLQSGVALIINLGLYLIIYKVMSGIQKDVMKIDDFSMFAIILVTSLALFPAVFYPMHYLTNGNWSTFDNIMKIWPFQLVVNGLCTTLNYFFLSRSNN